MHRVLVVAEKAADADGLAFRLGLAGFEATASAGETTLALRQLFAFKPDAIVFNCSAGDRQRKLFRLLETVSDLPVVVLGAGGDDEDEVVWYLDAGAADYVVRPVSPAHLSARLRVVLRHAAQDIPGGIIQVGDLEVDLDRHEVRRSGGQGWLPLESPAKADPIRRPQGEGGGLGDDAAADCGTSRFPN